MEPIVMSVMASDVSCIDLQFQGTPHLIATCLVVHPDGAIIVDPGPSSCLGALESGLGQHGVSFDDVSHVLLTHIHLDHAGASGALVRRYPHLRVVVHERGARHMADPSKLLESAARLYGDSMSSLWGEVSAVPVENLHVVNKDGPLGLGRETVEVAYTPGHASHHVSYLDGRSGCAFVGDTAGVLIDGGDLFPPTPPPDINLEQWRTSIVRIQEWSPTSLFLTHFGEVNSVGPHLDSLKQRLSALAELGRECLDGPGPDERRCRVFGERVRRQWWHDMDARQLSAYDLVVPAYSMWSGLSRYLAKQAPEYAGGRPAASG